MLHIPDRVKFVDFLPVNVHHNNKGKNWFLVSKIS